MNKTIFTGDKEGWSQDAVDFSNEVYRAIEPIFDKYLARGYKIRELSHIVMGAGFEMELMKVLK